MSIVTTPAPSGAAPAASGVVRRWILFTILYVLVILAASGIGALIGWMTDSTPDKGTYAIPTWLAYAFIAGPLAVLLWWLLWRRLDEADRGSYAWPLYLAAVYTLSLVYFTTAALSVASGLLTRDWQPWMPIGGALAWFLVWIAHRWMLRHRTRHPLRLAALPLILGAAFGLGVMAFNAARVLQSLFAQAFSGTTTQIGTSWWMELLGALVWCAGGVLIWWWHWRRDGVHALRGGFADVALLITGVFGAVLASLIAASALLSIGMRTAWAPSVRSHDIVADLSVALAALLIAAPVWLYHRRAALARDEGARSAVRLIESGVGMVGLAAGLGVVVNAALASLDTPLVGGGAHVLLFHGLSAMIAGGVLWFLAWKPLRVDEGAGDPARRIYLVVIFGASAVAAVGAVVTIGIRLFELGFEDGGSAVERIRTPLGVLLAAALAAGYHFAIWRRDRALAPAAAPVRRIGQVVLIGQTEDPEFARAVTAATGARVAVWQRADAPGVVATEKVIEALAAVVAPRVLVLAGSRGAVEVIPLAD